MLRKQQADHQPRKWRGRKNEKTEKTDQICIAVLVRISVAS